MKLSVELKNDIFIYEWEFGDGEKTHGEMAADASGIIIFSKFLQELYQHAFHRDEKEIMDIKVRAYIEQHPELLKKKEA